MHRLAVASAVLAGCAAPPRVPDDTLWTQPPSDEGVYAMVASPDQNDGDLMVLQRRSGISAGVARLSAATGDVVWRQDAHGAAMRMSGDGHAVMLSPASDGGYDVAEIDGNGVTLSMIRFDVVGRLVSFAVGGRMAALLTCRDFDTLCHIEVRTLDGGSVVWARSWVPQSVGDREIAVAADGSVAHAGFSVFDSSGNVVATLDDSCVQVRFFADGDLLCARGDVIRRRALDGAVRWTQQLQGNAYEVVIDQSGHIYVGEVIGTPQEGTGALEQLAPDGTSVDYNPFYKPAFYVAVGRYTFVYLGSLGVVALR